MKQKQSLWHRLAMLLLSLVIAAVGIGCSRTGNTAQTSDKKSPLVGKYTLAGEREVVSEIELYADGKFEYAMVYGAHEEGAAGTWKSTDKQVLLEVDKSQQGKTGTPPTDKLELRRDADNLVLTRNGTELVYLKAPSKTIADDKGNAVKPGKTVKVDIVGYNYTDHYIESFSVNGYGGGHIALSSPTSGGGGEYCCFYYIEGIGFPYEVEVEWGSSDRWGPTQKAKVRIPQPKLANPHMLEIHFYPDGHLEAELTDWYSDPRLKLTRKNDYHR
jgi:hypothetical protein